MMTMQTMLTVTIARFLSATSNWKRRQRHLRSSASFELRSAWISFFSRSWGSVAAWRDEPGGGPRVFGDEKKVGVVGGA